MFHVSWVRIKGRWYIIGKSVMRHYAVQQAIGYRCEDNEQATRVVLWQGHHPAGPWQPAPGGDRDTVEMTDWDGKTWTEEQACPF